MKSLFLSFSLAFALVSPSWSQSLDWTQISGEVPFAPIITPGTWPIGVGGEYLGPLTGTANLGDSNIYLKTNIYRLDLDGDLAPDGVLFDYGLSYSPKVFNLGAGGSPLTSLSLDSFIFSSPQDALSVKPFVAQTPLNSGTPFDGGTQAIVTELDIFNAQDGGDSYKFLFEGNNAGLYRLNINKQARFAIFVPGVDWWVEKTATYALADGTTGTVKYAAPVPEPGLMLAMGAGLAFLGAKRRRAS